MSIGNSRVININKAILFMNCKKLLSEHKELKESFEHVLGDEGYHKIFEIDKHWIESKMVIKELKTDTGLQSKSDLIYLKIHKEL